MLLPRTLPQVPGGRGVTLTYTSPALLHAPVHVPKSPCLRVAVVLHAAAGPW
jgi:hypothetical protein